MTKRFGRYVAIPDGIGTAAVLDRTSDRAIASGLPPADAEQLARDWNRHEPPEVSE